MPTGCKLTLRMVQVAMLQVQVAMLQIFFDLTTQCKNSTIFVMSLKIICKV